MTEYLLGILVGFYFGWGVCLVQVEIIEHRVKNKAAQEACK